MQADFFIVFFVENSISYGCMLVIQKEYIL